MPRHRATDDESILLLTHEADASADLVEERLRQRGARCYRFDTATFPSASTLGVTLSRGCAAGTIHVGTEEVLLSSIRSIWNRRALAPVPLLDLEPPVRDWVSTESSHALRCLWSVLADRFWMNAYFCEDKARLNKWHQANVANAIGFRVPDSLLTNRIEDAVRFSEEHDGKIVIKAVKQGFADTMDGDRRVFLTSRVERADLLGEGAAHRVSICPVFLQERIEKNFELRVTVVGQKVFACAIDSQADDLTRDDWRRQFETKRFVRHSEFRLPDLVRAQCLRVVDRLALAFGAIDLIVTPGDEYVFLEVNPNGQWGWIEELTDLPIADAIAETLIGGSPVDT